MQRLRIRRAPGPAARDAQPTTPAGAEPQEPGAPSPPSFRDRGRLRRRLRYLRRIRELGFRDLGGLVFDLHRFSRSGDHLIRSKLAALLAVDSELRALEHVLDDRRPITELREPGIAACPRCGALHGSDAHYCPSCGTPLAGPRALVEVGEGAVQAIGEIGAVSPPPPGPAPQAPGLPGQERAAQDPASSLQPTAPMPAVLPPHGRPPGHDSP